MTEKHQHVESLEEMVFKNRNKTYGAYMLRKRYKKYIIVSTIIAFFVMAGIVAYPIITAVVNKGRILKEEMSVGAEFR